MKCFTMSLFVVALSPVCLAGMAQAEFITNGGFDTGLGGWVNNNVGYYSSTDPGLAFLKSGDSYLSQAIQQGGSDYLVAAGTYTLSYDSKNVADDPAAAHSWVAAKLLYDVGQQTMSSWTIDMPSYLPEVVQNNSFSFTALAGGDYIGKKLTVELRNVNGGQWAAVDNVSLNFTAIPEPSSIVLLSVGTLGLLAYAWRKSR